MTESALLSVVAGVLELEVAWLLQSRLAHMAPPGLPRLDAIGFGGTTPWFALAATGAGSLIFGLIPALRGSAGDVHRASLSQEPQPEYYLPQTQLP